MGWSIPYFIVLTTLFTITKQGNSTSVTSTLKLIQVIFRHGDRTNDVSTIYPNDPYKNLTYYPTGIGELTLEGKRTIYRKVGKPLRKRYNHFLGDIYTPGMLEARSTDVSRAKASLLLVLAALFPPSKTQKWEDDFNWQPIPTDYVPFEEDKDFFGIYLEDAVKLLEAHFNTTEYQEKFNKHKDLAAYVTKHTGWTMKDMSLFAYLYFGLTSEKEMGLELPDWTKSIYPQPLERLAEVAYYDYAATDEIIKHSAGYMLKKILKDAHAKINDGNNIKIHLLSGHEINCANMLLLLGLFKPHIPPYGAHIIFELHKIDGTYGYKIFYQDFKQNEPLLLEIPKCGEFCPLDKFETLYKKFLP